MRAPRCASRVQGSYVTTAGLQRVTSSSFESKLLTIQRRYIPRVCVCACVCVRAHFNSAANRVIHVMSVFSECPGAVR